MAGGYQTVVSGTNITAAWANSYVRDQVVSQFTSTSARDSAITSPQVGMVCYVKSNDASEGLYTYTSAGSWRKGPGWNAPWGVQGTPVTSGVAGTSTASTTAVDEGMAVASFTAFANRLFVAHLVVHPFVSAGSVANATFTVLDNSNATVRGQWQFPSGTLSTTIASSRALVTVPWTTAAGTVSYKVQMFSGSGSTTIQSYGAGGQARGLWIEDIGPAGAPA